MKTAIRMNMIMDKESQQSARKKRPFTSSQLVRFWFKVLLYDEDRLYQMKKEDEEFRAIMLYLQPKLQALLDSIRGK